MYSEATKKIELQFQNLNLKCITDQQLIKFFQVVDLSLPKDTNLSDIDYNLIESAFDLYLKRVNMIFKNINYANLDNFDNHVLNKIPERFRELLNDHLNDTFINPDDLVFTKFDSKITKLEVKDDFIAASDDKFLRIFRISTGELMKEFNVRDKVTFAFSPNYFIMISHGLIKRFDFNFEFINCLPLSLCPNEITCITDNVIQFYDKNTVGNLILADSCEIHYFTAINECEVSNLNHHCCGDINLYASDNKIIMEVFSLNYSLINKAKDRTNNNYLELLEIKKSVKFTKLSSFLKMQYVNELRDIASSLTMNDGLFK